MIYNIIYYIIIAIIFAMIVFYIEDAIANNLNSKSIEFEGQTIVIPDLSSFEGEPKIIKSNGSKLACETLSKVTGQKVKYNKSIDNDRGFLYRGQIVDCFEIQNNIMLDYIPREYYTYNGPDEFNRNIYDAYNRWALHESKKDRISNEGLRYIEIPFTVDKCHRDNTGKLICKQNVPENIRRQRLEEYLREKVLAMF